jgi:cyclic nucleotide gated channel beta 1
LSISVYLELISKVKLFQECEKNLLYALVLKLKPVIFMPGDHICRKGEVGREMFIVDSGIVEVIVGDKAVAQMKVGSYFGEISLLSMGDGGNRRTANVVSKGFSKLLVLHKSDFNLILADYPEMNTVLRKTAE